MAARPLHRYHGAMETSSHDELADRLELALDLYAAGEAMMRSRLRREHPAASEAELEEMLVAWLRRRPGAPLGDAPGRPRELRP